MMDKSKIQKAIENIKKFYGDALFSKDAGIVTKGVEELLNLATAVLNNELVESMNKRKNCYTCKNASDFEGGGRGCEFKPYENNGQCEKWVDDMDWKILYHEKLDEINDLNLQIKELKDSLGEMREEDINRELRFFDIQYMHDNDLHYIYKDPKIIVDYYEKLAHALSGKIGEVMGEGEIKSRLYDEINRQCNKLKNKKFQRHIPLGRMGWLLKPLAHALSGHVGSPSIDINKLRNIIKYQIEAYGGKTNPKDDFNGFIYDIQALLKAGLPKGGDTNKKFSGKVGKEVV